MKKMYVRNEFYKNYEKAVENKYVEEKTYVKENSYYIERKWQLKTVDGEIIDMVELKNDFGGKQGMPMEHFLNTFGELDNRRIKEIKK